jgi:small GTP-binding protein
MAPGEHIAKPHDSKTGATMKVLLRGRGGSGKSTLLYRYAFNKYPLEYVSTFQDTFDCKMALLDGRPIHLGVWDTGVRSEEAEWKLMPLSFQQTDVFLLTYDIAAPDSLKDMRDRILPQVRYYCPNALLILTGCKLDLRNDENTIEKLKTRSLGPISREEAEELARKEHLHYAECSALTGEGVKEVLDLAVRLTSQAASALVTPKKQSSGCRVL